MQQIKNTKFSEMLVIQQCKFRITIFLKGQILTTTNVLSNNGTCALVHYGIFGKNISGYNKRCVHKTLLS